LSCSATISSGSARGNMGSILRGSYSTDVAMAVVVSWVAVKEATV